VATSLNIITLVVSLVALGVSSFLAIRQIGTARNANQLAVVNETLREFWSPGFRNQEALLWDKLRDQREDVAYSQLPDNLMETADSVCSMYLMLAYVVSIVDWNLAILPISYRVVRTWAMLSPFVVRERELRGYEASFFSVLESFVKFIERQDLQSIAEELKGQFK
jgi:hypothetical protein